MIYYCFTHHQGLFLPTFSHRSGGGGTRGVSRGVRGHRRRAEGLWTETCSNDGLPPILGIWTSHEGLHTINEYILYISILYNATCLKMIYISYYGHVMPFNDTEEHEPTCGLKWSELNNSTRSGLVQTSVISFSTRSGRCQSSASSVLVLAAFVGVSTMNYICI